MVLGNSLKDLKPFEIVFIAATNYLTNICARLLQNKRTFEDFDGFFWETKGFLHRMYKMYEVK